MTADTPFFVSPHKKESEGVDFLGLRALNLTMMGRLIPGINNVVSMIRPFTLMSWVAWRFVQGVGSRPAQVVSTAEFETFKQKVETVYAFSQVAAGDAQGLPGRQQRPPAGKVIRFQFGAFQRTGSILDAALYGPAIKELSGLSFLEQHSDARFYVVTPAGKKLALALDARLRRHLRPEQYEFISSLTQVEARRDLIDDNFPKAWGLSHPSKDEQLAFRENFFVPHKIGSASAEGRRSTLLVYVLELLREHPQGLPVPEVRRLLACRYPKALARHAAHRTFAHMQRYWQLLQVRQAQRLGLEALFGWVERMLWQEATSVGELVIWALKSLKMEPGSPDDARFLAAQMQQLRAAGNNVDALFAAALRAPEADLDLFLLSDELELAVRKRPDDVVRLALRLLLLAARYGELLNREEATRQEVDAGPKFRLPLGGWCAFVQKHESQPLSHVLQKVLGSFVVSQHLGVAAARSSDEKSRMRLSIEDRGLTSVLSGPAKALKPRRTADRLPSAMALMAQCGLLRAQTVGTGRDASVHYAVA